MPHQHAVIITCPKGLESLLLEEATTLGLEEARAHPAAIAGTATLQTAYRLCLWLRLANRVLLVLQRFSIGNAQDLYEAVRAVDWAEHLSPEGSLAVMFTGTGAGIDNTHFGALKLKDAIVDALRTPSGVRPSIDKLHPDVRVHAHLERGQVTLSLDLSGQSLHQRGYRLQQGAAPLKENLAAAILLRAGWPALAAEGAALVDPMCGVATLLIEGAWMAADRAPQLTRQHWGFSHWLGHVPVFWQSLAAEAQERATAGLARRPLWIRGYEADPRLMNPARHNIARAGLEQWIKVYQGELSHFAPRPDQHQVGLVVCNPPYGERLGTEADLLYLYQSLGERLRTECQGWQAAVFTGTPDLGKRMGLRSHKQYAFWNGALPCKLLLFQVLAERFVTERRAAHSGLESAAAPALLEQPKWSAGGQMFANRLSKNLKQRVKWARAQAVQCYRIYDADMPEYALAIDRYGDWAHVQEYAAPSSIDPQKAEQRLFDALAVIPQVLGIDPSRVVLKRRQRQKGSQQYQRQADQGNYITVQESGLSFLVNLTDYLDTGLFLDHRPLRQMLQRQAQGARFLNLFCYTASATVHAAKGGARSTTSVDLSKTYLDWARRNLSLNGFSERHRLEQAEVMTWLAQDGAEYDLIFIDPPTFSNSKRMTGVFDVQRDHVLLLDLSMARLAAKGCVYFSNNFRGFVLDPELSNRYQVTEITPHTIDVDFAQNPKIHRVWRFQLS